MSRCRCSSATPPTPSSAATSARQPFSRSTASGSLDAVLDGEADQLVPAAEPELGQDVADMVLDRLLGDEQLGADLAIAVPPGHQLEHLPLPRRQRLRSARGGLEAAGL